MSAAPVRLGGAWKIAVERQEALERSVRLLTDELACVRGLLEKAECAKEDLKTQLERLAAENALSRLKGLALAGKLKENQALALERQRQLDRAEQRQQQIEHQLSLTGQQLVQVDQRLRDEVDRKREATHRLESALAEVAEMQNQYDLIEERAERAEAAAKEERERAQVLAKAKEQKERYVCILVKERDRLQTEVIGLRSESSKAARKRADKAAARGLVENRQPNAPMVSKLAESEHGKLVAFTASNKLKSQLSHEIARRKQAESTVDQLRQQVTDLRTRYRNLTRSS